MSSPIDTAHLDGLLAASVRSGALPNVAAIAADADGIRYAGAAGPRELGGTEQISVDTQFRIMSMTKIVATVAALQLAERGQLELAAPVAEYLPEFGTLQVLVGFDGDTPKLRPPARRATVHDLVTHTSGLAYWFLSDDMTRWERATGTPPVISGSRRIFTAPLMSDPGTRFSYGTNTDWLGLVVEAAGGRGLDVAIREGITGPLGMAQTTFVMSEQQRENSTPVYLRGADGSWTALGELLSQQPQWWSGGHGLYSTPRDYIRFQRALLRGGELDGERILTEASVDAAFTNQIGELDFPADLTSNDPKSACTFSVGPGWKWGLGLLLNTADQPGMRRAGAGAWAGLCNTYFWVDRQAGVCGSTYSNYLPFASPEALALAADFERAVYASR